MIGTLLVAIAVIVFTAVNWSDLGGWAQGAILLGITVLAAAGTVLAGHRAMPATAEALGTVTVLLALGDVHALRVAQDPSPDAYLWWAAGVAVIAVLALGLARWSRTESPAIAAGLLVQVPLLILLEYFEASRSLGSVLVLAQCAIVFIVAVEWRAPSHPARVAGFMWAALLAVVATLDMMVLAADAQGARRAEAGGVVVMAAGVAALVAWLRKGDNTQRSMAWGSSLVLAFIAVFVIAASVTGAPGALAVTAVVALATAMLGTRLPEPWSTLPAAVGLSAASVGAAPVALLAYPVFAEAMDVVGQAWALTWPEEAWTNGARGVEGSYLEVGFPAWAIAADLAVFASMLALGWRRMAPGVRSLAVVALGLLGLSVVPVMAPLSIASTVIVTLVAGVGAAGAAIVWRSVPQIRRSAALGVVLALALAALWALATPGLTTVMLGTSVVVAAALLVAMRTVADRLLVLGATAWVTAAVPLLSGVVAHQLWDDRGWSWSSALAVGALCSVVVALLLDPVGNARTLDREAVGVAEVGSVVIHLLGVAVLFGLGEVGPLSVGLAAGVLAFGAHATRPHRRWAVLPAAAEAVVLGWVRLDDAGVTTVEAYTLPVAVLLLVVGSYIRWRSGQPSESERSGPLASWVWLGPGLLVGLVPTIVLSFSESGQLRPLLGLVAGAVLLIAGAITGQRAPVDIGALTVVALGLRQLAPAADDIPTWAIIGIIGLVLVGVGATFEQRRKDVRTFRRRYSSLR